MNVAYISDLHLEMWNGTFPMSIMENTTCADVLILAGDTICVGASINDRAIASFFDYVSNQFPCVLIVMGNHEFYYADYYTAMEKFARYLTRWHNIRLLENSMYSIESITFMGATLWTDLTNADVEFIQGIMNDFKLITFESNPISPKFVTGRHTVSKDSLDLIYEFQAAACEQVVVITHHAPSFLSVHPNYADSKLNRAFVSNMDDWIISRPKITNWIHGHTHHTHEYNIANCCVRLNAFGYPGEQTYNAGLMYFTV